MKNLILTLLLLLCSLQPGMARGGQNPGVEAEAEFFDPFEKPVAPDLADPLEPLNRVSFWLNDKLYTHILKPACSMLPAGVLERFGSDLADLDAPEHVGLEFKFRDAGSEAGRLLLESLLKVLHYFEPVKTAALAQMKGGYGRVMEAFGMEPGIYLVLPVLGPSSLREGIGQLISLYFDPSKALLDIRRDCPIGGEARDLLADLETYASIRASTLDPYLSIRNAYTQQQASEDRKALLLRAARPAGTRSASIL